jgi:molecular chaperone GrpE
VSRADVPEEPERVVIRDNRKIDPKTGEARKRSDDVAGAASAAPAAPPATEPSSGPVVDAALLDERTADLQRVQAEYANYRKRADRERLAAGDLAVGRVLGEFLPVLDDLDRAAAHGDLESGPLKAIADKLTAVLDKLGLEPFGEVGDRFDPAVHEAVMHNESDDVTEPTCTTVLRKGYRYRDRLVRPAMVGVSDPVTASEPSPSTNGTQREAEQGNGGAQDESSETSATPPEGVDATHSKRAQKRE